MTKLYIALQEGLVVAAGQQDLWRADWHMVGLAPECVAVDPFGPERLYCGTSGNGLWRSEDEGVSWQPVGPGISHADVTAVVVSSVEQIGGRGVVWAGTEPSALFRSEDGGDSWQERRGLRSLPSASTWSYPPRPWTHHVRWITPDPHRGERLLVSIEAGGVLRSRDAGQSWEDRKPQGPRDAHTLLAHPQAPDRLYAAAGDGFSSPGSGYAESPDGGDSWRRFGAGLHHHYLWGMALDPHEPDTVVVSAARGPREAHQRTIAESTLYRRTAGEAWQEIRAGLPEPRGTLIPVLAANQAEPGAFYLASNRGVFRSADAGLTWERLLVPWPESFSRQHPRSLVVVR